MGLTEILMFEGVGVAIDECSARGEVQIFLNFVLQGFRLYDILAALSGEKEGEENYEPRKWYNMRIKGKVE